MDTIPSVNQESVLFETHIREDAPPEAERKGLHIGNRVTCAVPIALDLIDYYARNEQTLPADIQLQAEEYEFWLLRLGWTLHPDPHASVSWMDFGVELGYYSFIPANTRRDYVLREFEERISPPEENSGTPIAYDLYPSSVTEEKEVGYSVKLSPSLKFKEVSASLGEAGLTVQYKKLCPKITACAEREANFYWHFLPGVGHHTVAEGQKEVDAIIRKRRGTIVGGRIQFKGKGTQWGIIPQTHTSEATVFYL